MPGLRLNPLTQRKLRRFREIKRGYWSFLVLVALVLLSLGAELLINSHALAVRYQGRWYFPTYSAVKLGADFGLKARPRAPPSTIALSRLTSRRRAAATV